MGRPTDYREEYNDQAYKLALLGLIDTEMAEFFGVNPDTIYEWKKTYPLFSESIKNGKLLADGNVATSLYKRATGYDAPETDIKVIDGQVVQTNIIKHYPPDPTSMIFFLKNRQKKNWRDKQEIDHTTNGKEILHTVPQINIINPHTVDAKDNKTD